ncbi:hypothetical protein [Clostridium thermarum]|uniref:hypothetical protein n=1 Tax=Clostridium thermarum TaxID=1716543 RepID=UPI0013D00642|nr:hypothetical protein [Clostridium thermarum]
MKKKGYTLLLAIVSISIVATLAAAISALALASYRNEVNENKRNMLRLKAESGIEEQIHLIKNYIIENYTEIYLDDSKPIDYGEIAEADDTDDPEDGIWRDITLSDVDDEGNDKYTDPRTGRQVYFLRILSQCQFVDETGQKVGKPLTVEVVIDRSTIYSEYFERIFNRASFTTAPTSTKSTLIDSKFTLLGQPLETSGKMFLQGDVIFKPDTTNLKFYEGEVKVKAPEVSKFNTNIVSEITATPGNYVNLIKDVEGSDPSRVWIDKDITYLPMCNIRDISDEDSKMQIIPASASSTPISDEVINIQEDINLVTYKVKSERSINFQELIDGALLSGDSEDSLYYHICKKLEEKYDDEGINPLEKYGEYYKVILIDGDLDIQDDDFRIFNNYILYVTGNVTFEGQAEFYNSSIFAKEIEINGSVIFNGVNTSKSLEKIIGSENLKDFDPDQKDYINDYFIRNLEGYGDYLKFNKLYWNEY